MAVNHVAKSKKELGFMSIVLVNKKAAISRFFINILRKLATDMRTQ